MEMPKLVPRFGPLAHFASLFVEAVLGFARQESED